MKKRSDTTGQKKRTGDSARRSSAPSTAAGGPAVSNRSAGRLLQRASTETAVIGKKATSIPVEDLTDDKGQSIRVVRPGPKTAVAHGTALKVDTDQRAMSKPMFDKNKADATAVVGEFVRIDPYTDQWIDARYVSPPPPRPRDPKKATMGGAHKRVGELLGVGASGADLHDFEQSDQISELKKDIKGLPDGALKDTKKAEKGALGDQRTDEAMAGSALTGGTQLITLVSSITKLVQSEGGWKRAEAGMDVVEQTAKTGSAVADIVDKAGKQKYGSSAGFGGQASGAAEGVEKSTMAAGVTGAIGEILSGVIALVKRVKAIVDLVKSDKKLSKKEKLDAAMDTIKDAGSSAKSAVSAAKSIIDVTDSAGASDALASAVPGLGIAIAAVDMIKRAFKLVVDYANKKLARKEKRTEKEKLAAIQSIPWKKNWRGKMTKKDIKKKYVDITGRLQSGAAVEDYEKKAIPIMEEYLFAKELQVINDKRITRQAIGIGLDANSIIADALNLGGVTAAAGLSLKITGGVVKFFVPAVRRFKQWARDKAAKNADPQTGQATGILSLFNASKSTDAKAKAREDMINRMFKHLADWFNMAETSPQLIAAKEAQGERVKAYFNAAGMTWANVERYDDAPELAEALDKALKARE